CWDDKYGPLSALMMDGKAEVVPSLLLRLAEAGIRLRTFETVTAECPREAQTLLTLAHPVVRLLEPMMKESDNVLAECLFYQLAFQSGKKGAGRKQATTYVDRILERLNVPARSWQVADGSGLSLYNYLTPETLVSLLNYAYQQPNIYNTLSMVLPIAGVDGTLKKRLLDSPAMGNVRAKTGSVTGISSLSGYATGGNGHVLSFCIINQGVERTAEGRAFQDKVCTALCTR
ncbi:MAG: D-alanyl-D-alanine carboxypeptidase/D-alanyl-D-alanine-endopeptidase, partial [Bacteroidaceae bacterium]|nr:D-alanyl-D-alanine carboxypeptidase/D-alanyl-D-alanine-endopeptidase [Bacteroidaceae bacterium]